MHAFTVHGSFVHGLVLSAVLALSACGGGGGGGTTPVAGGGGTTPPSTTTPTPDAQPPSPAGVSISVFAGAVRLAGSADGVGMEARFNGPTGVAQDAAGNVYVADTGNHVIRKIAPDRTVTTFAGVAGQAGSADGPRAAARFRSPEGVAVDAAGVVYVADTENHTVRRIGLDGTVSTVAGVAGQSGRVDGTGSGARFLTPNTVAVDASGNLYVASIGGLRKVSPAGAVSMFVDDATIGFVTVDGAGNVYAGRRVSPGFSNPVHVDKFSAQGQRMPFGGSTVGINLGYLDAAGIAADAAGNVYVAGTRVVLRIAPDGTSVILAGDISRHGSTDGPAASASFRHAYGISAGPGGRIVVAERDSGAIRQVDAQGVVSTLAGGEGDGKADGQGAAARFYFPEGLAVAADGSLFVGDAGNEVLRKVSPGGVVSTLGLVLPKYDAFDGSVAVDGQGTLYFIGPYSGNTHPIYALSASGQLRTHAQYPGHLTTLASGPDGKLYVGTQGSIAVLNPDGSSNRTITGLDCLESSIAVSGTLVYIACGSQHTVRSVDAQGRVAIVAGQMIQRGSVDGVGMQARLDDPRALALDSVGNLYIADASTIRSMTPDGDVRTIALAAYPPFPRNIRSLAWSSGMLYAAVAHGVLKIGPVN